MTDMVDAIGYAAGFFAMVTFCPQIVKTLRTRKADDISLLMLLLTLATNILYVIYGMLLELYPVVIMIGIMTCLVVVQIALTLKYNRDAKRKSGQRGSR